MKREVKTRIRRHKAQNTIMMKSTKLREEIKNIEKMRRKNKKERDFKEREGEMINVFRLFGSDGKRARLRQGKTKDE
jgi:hypothetical protein